MDAIAQRYSKLPTEILALSPGDFHLNLCIAFPDTIKAKQERAERAEREAKLGYNPILRLLEMLKGARSQSKK